MKQAFFIMQVREGNYFPRELVKIDDQPLQGFRDIAIARQQLKNLLTEGKDPYCGSNSFTIIEIYNKA